jgi:Flp pilus assembly protein TadG
MVMLYSYPQPGLREERRALRRVMPLIVLLLLSPLVPLGGLGVDSVRTHMVEARLERAVDAAALAGGRVFFDSQRNNHINQFFEAVFPKQFLGSVPASLNVDVDAAEGTLTVTARTTVKRYFYEILGYGDAELEAVSKVHRPSRNAEAVLARAH